MFTMRLRHLLAVAICGLGFVAPTAAPADEITVMCSGGFTAALKQLGPAFEQKTGHKVKIVLGPSMGTSNEAIPNRLQRGEPADLLIMVGYALDGLAQKGLVDRASVMPLVDSKIGLAVKAGAPKPDISTVAAFKAALLSARSIAYSDSASGVYVETEMYKTLGLTEQLMPKSRRIVRDPVGGVVAKGEAEVGLQQVSELLPVKGVDFVGTIPDEVQKVTVFSAGFPTASRSTATAKAFLDYLRSKEARPTIEKTGVVLSAGAAL